MKSTQIDQNITTIVFDFFGVLCSEIAPFWLLRHFSDEDALRVKGSVVGLADQGLISEQSLFDKLSSLTGIGAQQVRAEWLELAILDVATVSLASELRTEFKLGLLTNAPSDFVRSLIARFGVDSLFSQIVVSSEIGAAKPDPRTYRAILSKLGAEPAESLMIDDNPINVEGAINAGMQALLFTSAKDLSTRFRSRD